MSAIGADANSTAQYARTTAAGEAAVREAYPAATILRPSVVFGAEDAFFNRFGAMAAVSPALPLIGGGKTRFQPVFVGDVGEAIASALTDPATAGRTYELGGPAIYTFKALMQIVLRESLQKRALIPVPFPVASLLGKIGDLQAALLPFAPQITSDQVENLRNDNVVGDSALGLEALGLSATALDSVLPTYMWIYRRGGQFAQPGQDNA
jgi:NADH dehydrogenase